MVLRRPPTHNLLEIAKSGAILGIPKQVPVIPHARHRYYAVIWVVAHHHLLQPSSINGLVHFHVKYYWKFPTYKLEVAAFTCDVKCPVNMNSERFVIRRITTNSSSYSTTQTKATTPSWRYIKICLCDGNLIMVRL
ncbi:Arginine decarboxylase [Dirofilaria immitis]